MEAELGELPGELAALPDRIARFVEPDGLGKDLGTYEHAHQSRDGSQERRNGKMRLRLPSGALPSPFVTLPNVQ